MSTVRPEPVEGDGWYTQDKLGEGAAIRHVVSLRGVAKAIHLITDTDL